MADTIATQEPTSLGPTLFSLSPEKLAEIQARAKAEVQAREDQDLIKNQVHQAKMQKVTDARRLRKKAGLEERERERVREIREMDPKKREGNRQRTNFMTDAMRDEYDRLDYDEMGQEIPLSKRPATQASVEELKAEIARREVLDGAAQPQVSASAPDTEEGTAEDDNALDETLEPRTKKVKATETVYAGPGNQSEKAGK